MSSSTGTRSLHPSRTTGFKAGIIAPSILSADFANLGRDSQEVVDLGAEWLHIDVMDGHFVPNLTIGAPVVSSLRKAIQNVYFDVHLMIENPEKWVNDFAKAGADGYTFHIEAAKDPKALIEQIHAAGMRAGITLKPGTALDTILPYVPLVDLVLVMTVEPGFGGQKFMADQMTKVRTLRAQYPDLDIEVDGGLAPDTIETAAEAGANVIVAGSAVFNVKEKKQAMDMMRDTVQKHIKRIREETKN